MLSNPNILRGVGYVCVNVRVCVRTRVYGRACVGM